MMKKIRIKRNESQAEVARNAQMHPSSISVIENGGMRPYPGQIEKLIAALDWKEDPEKLFEEVGD